MNAALEIQSLPQRLRNADPRVRVQTLRILAMVEETQALRAVSWMVERDPEPGVRAVARWACEILQQADARGHSTQQAVQDRYRRTEPVDREEAFLAELELDISGIGKNKARHYALEQAYRRQLDDLLRKPRAETEQCDADPPLLPPPPGGIAGQSVDGPADFSDLLDAGLTHLMVDP